MTPEFFYPFVMTGCFAILVYLGAKCWTALFGLAENESSSKADKDQELCSKCGYDVRGLMRCPECGIATPADRRRKLTRLREEWPTESMSLRIPEPGEVPVTVLEIDHAIAGQLLCRHLEARGIFAQFGTQKPISGALPTQRTLPRQLMVWSGDEQRARAIVQHLWPDDL